MGASVIEQIYLPNCLCASGIKPTKSQKSEGNWVFKLARSTYAQAGEISPRTPPAITANDAWYHRERRRLSLESMDLDTEQLSRSLIHNNLRTVTIGDMNPDKIVVF